VTLIEEMAAAIKDAHESKRNADYFAEAHAAVSALRRFVMESSIVLPIDDGMDEQMNRVMGKVLIKLWIERALGGDA
jgi:hypothetical protein